MESYFFGVVVNVDAVVVHRENAGFCVWWEAFFDSCREIETEGSDTALPRRIRGHKQNLVLFLRDAFSRILFFHREKGDFSVKKLAGKCCSF